MRDLSHGLRPRSAGFTRGYSPSPRWGEEASLRLCSFPRSGVLRRHRRRRDLAPRPLFAAGVDPAEHVDGGLPPAAVGKLAVTLGLVAIVRKPNVAGSPSEAVMGEFAGVPASTSFTHTSAPSTPRGRARRVGVDSSVRRSVCVSRSPARTTARGRVAGVVTGVPWGSRTVIPIAAAVIGSVAAPACLTRARRAARRVP